MKLIHAICNVVIPEDHAEKWRYSAPFEAIVEALGIGHIYSPPDAVEAALKAYPIFNWMCTDEEVGLDALYFQDEPAASIFRSGRKMGYEIKWVSAIMARRVRDFILDNAETPPFDILDYAEDIDTVASVQYVGQSPTADGFFEGRPVRALVWYDGLMTRTTPIAYRKEGRPYMQAVPFEDSKSNCVLVQDGDEQRVIPIEQFMIPIAVKEPT